MQCGVNEVWVGENITSYMDDPNKEHCVECIRE